jgi:hypothetical protein
MNKEENNFEEFLRAKLENHTVEVNDSVWAAIEKKQKKREKFIWFKQYLNVFLALDILFLLGFSAFTILNTNDVQSKNNVQAVAQIQTETPVTNATSSAEAIMANVDTTTGNKQIITNYNAPLASITKQEIVSKKEKTHSSKTITTIDNTVISSNKNNAVTTKKTSISSKEKIVMAPLNQPVHNEILNENIETNQPVYAILKPIAWHAVAKEKYNHFNINASEENIEYLPPSIVQSKSKKVLKAEQKAIEKVNKALAKEDIAKQKANEQASKAIAKEAVAKQKAIEKKEADAQEKAMDQNKTEEANAVSTENEIAPLALDTVYGKKKFKGYVAIDALISPDIAGRTLKGNTEQVSNYISRRDSAEKMQISYSALMRINLFINRNIFINTGISFSQRKEKFSIEHKWQTHEDYIDSSKFITIIDPFAGSTIYKTYDTLDYVRTNKEILNHNLTMTFVDVPAMIGYKWLGKRSGIAVQGGVIFNLLFKQKGSIADFNYTANDVAQPNQNPFNTTAGISLAGGISTNHKLTDKLDLMIEPHTRYTLKPINNSSYPLQQKLFSYGLNVGLRLKL